LVLDVDERISNLVAASAASGTAIEQELYGEVIEIAPVITSSTGTSHPLLAILETRQSAFFKRFCDQNANLCRQYGHDRMDPPLNEVAAWRLAYALGDPAVADALGVELEISFNVPAELIASSVSTAMLRIARHQPISSSRMRAASRSSRLRCRCCASC
jgi:hypothetical protein